MEEDKLNKAIDLLKSEVKIYDQYYCLATSQALKTVLNELDRLQKENEQKNKIIDLMAEDIYDSQIECNRYFRDKEEVKASFLLECLESEE